MRRQQEKAKHCKKRFWFITINHIYNEGVMNEGNNSTHAPFEEYNIIKFLHFMSLRHPHLK